MDRRIVMHTDRRTMAQTDRIKLTSKYTHSSVLINFFVPCRRKFNLWIGKLVEEANKLDLMTIPIKQQPLNTCYSMIHGVIKQLTYFSKFTGSALTLDIISLSI